MIGKSKTTLFSFVLTAVVLLALCATAGAAAWSSSDKWAEYSNGGYTIRNDVWGSGAGSQTIWANSYKDWGVWANHPNTSGVKSYPHVAKAVSKNVSAITSLSSTFGVTRPSGGSYSTTYDIWLDSSKYEVMIWMNKTGSVGPIASSWDSSGNPVAAYSNLSLGGHTWNVYNGSNGSNKVFSFVRTSNTNSGTVDLKAILAWIKQKGWYGDALIGEVQFGFEITASSGGMDFACTNYSLSINSSSSSSSSSTSTSSTSSSSSSTSSSSTSSTSSSSGWWTSTSSTSSSSGWWSSTSSTSSSSTSSSSTSSSSTSSSSTSSSSSGWWWW